MGVTPGRWRVDTLDNLSSPAITLQHRVSTFTETLILEPAARSNELAGLIREDAASLAPYTAHLIGCRLLLGIKRFTSLILGGLLVQCSTPDY